ncbi:MAG: peptidoglycan-binding domain-containing protein [Pseudomonadota bacterium]
MTINFNAVPSYVRREIDPPKRMVKKGVRNQAARRIQEWLNFHQCRTSIDGDFGPATESCVKDFQANQGVRVTGRVDRHTWEALSAPMRVALETPSIERMSAVEAVRTVAEQHVTQHPMEIGGANRGPWVRLYCGGQDGPDWAWCAGFVTLVMQQAYFYRGEKVPIAGSVSCDSLAAQAKAAGLFVSERDITSGRVRWEDFGGACIFLRRRTPTDWTHTGIATAAEGRPRELVFSTIEGNTNDEGSREGFEACRRKRSVKSANYDFIRFN